MNKPSNSAGTAMSTPRAVYFPRDERNRAGLDALREGIDNGFVRSRKLTYPQRPKVTLGPLSIWLLGFLSRFHVIFPQASVIGTQTFSFEIAALL